MTPTFIGRVQTRLVLFFFIGIPISLLVAQIYSMQYQRSFVDIAPQLILVALHALVIGLFLDWIYQKIQSMRWDNDWPPFFIVITGIIEGSILYALIYNNFSFMIKELLPLSWFSIHFGSIWFLSFISMLSILRVLFPLWRMRGAQFGKY